jgi:hypothetical protein
MRFGRVFRRLVLGTVRSADGRYVPTAIRFGRVSRRLVLGSRRSAG